MNENFLVKGGRGLAVPACGAERAFEVAIESLDVPAHVIQLCELRGGIQRRVQKRGDQTTPAKTVAVNEDHPDRELLTSVRVDDPAKVVTWAERTEHLWTEGALGGNDEMSFAGHDADEGCAVIEAVVEKNQVVLPQGFNELADELMFRSG